MNKQEKALVSSESVVALYVRTHKGYGLFNTYVSGKLWGTGGKSDRWVWEPITGTPHWRGKKAS